MNRETIHSSKLAGTLLLYLLLPFSSNSSFAQDDYADASTYATGDYRMVFSEYALNQVSETYEKVHPLEVDAKILDMYNQLFITGNASTQRIMYDALNGSNNPTGLKFIKDVNPVATSNDIRSEGISYGMMIAVMMDDQATFNALWGFARQFMYNNADGGEWYAWSLADSPPNYPMNRDAPKWGQNPAPDAEEFFAMALFFADHRWGSTGGQNDITNYRRWANDTLRILRANTSAPLWDQTNNMIEFSPYEGFTDPSYHVPAFYELWGLWADNNNAQWHAAADVSRQFFSNAVDDNRSGRTNTGLFPEYASYTGTPQQTDYNDLSEHSAFDAYRVIQNIAVDHYWWSKSPQMNGLVEGIMDFYDSDTELATPVGGTLAPFRYTGIYGLGQGSPLYITNGPWPNRATAPVPGLAAMNAVGALAADELYVQKFVQYLWDLNTPTGNGRYYDGLLQMFGYLHLAGYYRIYVAGEGNSMDMSMHTGRVDTNNNPIIYWGDDTYFTVAACPQGQSVTGTFTWAMNFTRDQDGIPGPDYPPITGVLTELSNGRYFGEIPAVYPSHFEFELTVTRHCNGTPLVETVAGYVDPSGYVRTTRGFPIPGAEVTLFQTETNDEFSQLVQLPNGSDQMAPYNRRNPDYTDSTGHFGWDVAFGHWYQVTASHPECFAPDNPSEKTVATPLMFVPPEVTDLDIRLECPGNRLVVDVEITDDWGTGYCADVVVTNNNSRPVDWDARFHVDGDINSFWNANYSQNGRVVEADGVAWNNILEARSSTESIGFCATRVRNTGPYPITVRARGTSGAEVINLTVGGTVVVSWKLSTSFQNYTVSTSLGGGVNVVYTNDNGVAYRDVVVDYVSINNVIHQTENQSQNTAVFGNGRCGGGSNSEWMHCSGWVGFPAFK